MNHFQLNDLIAQQHADELRGAAARERLAQPSHADRRAVRFPWPTITAPFGRFRSSRRRRLLGCLAAAALGVLGVGATPALAASSTFYYSPNFQHFTVPSGVTAIHFDVIGGSGANGQGSYGAGSGGSGAEVTGDISVSPGSVLTVWAGGAGQPDGGYGYGNAYHDGFNGGSGGSGYGITTGNGGGGGAASYVVLPTGPIVALAGGGGGGGGGGTAGTSAGNGSDGAYLSSVQDVNGWDATTASGGNGGGGAQGGNPNAYSDNGVDGAGGGDGVLFGGGGGGGGGGFFTCGFYCYGGGGGGHGGVGSGGGGGAGGNSYADSSATGVSFGSSGSSPGTAGQITLSYGSAIQLTSSSATSGPGQSVRFVADVDPADGGGTVTFTSDGTVIPGCSDLSFDAGGGTEWLTSCSTSSLPSGTHTITATYSGDGNYAGSSGTVTETVLPTTTSTSLSSSANPSLAGHAVTYTATVSPAPDDGTVAFSDAGSPIPGCTAQPLTSHGTATCQVTYTAAGSHAIQAEYSGDPSFASGTSPKLTQQVQASTSTSPPQGPPNPQGSPNPQGPTPPQGPSNPQSAPHGPQASPQSPTGPHGHPGQVVCRNTGPATATCVLVLKAGFWPTNVTATIANYRITRGSRTVARGTAAITQGRLVFRSRRLRPGRYELTLTFRHGQHQTIRVRRYFSVR